jgi:hypothetical protein
MLSANAGTVTKAQTQNALVLKKGEEKNASLRGIAVTQMREPESYLRHWRKALI